MACVADPPSTSESQPIHEQILHDARGFLVNRDRVLVQKDQVTEARRIAFEERFLDLIRGRLPYWEFDRKPSPRTRIATVERHAVLLLGDTHIGQCYRPEETDGLSGYNPRIFISRLRYLGERIRAFAQDFPATSIRVLLLGDLLHGQLNHCAEREDTLLVVDQFSLAIHALSNFIVGLSDQFPEVRCRGVVGNHGRWPNQRKMPSVGRQSNLDGLVLRAMQAVMEPSGVILSFDSASRQIVEIAGTRIHMMHGDEIRGGGEVPYRGMIREATANAFRAAARGVQPADVFVMGDKHRSMQLPVGESQFVVNGAFTAGDQFGQNFSPVRPSQTLFWIEEGLGKVAQAEIPLDLAPLLSPQECRLPNFLQRFLTI